MIAAEQHIAKRKAQMPAHMTGGVQHAKGLAGKGQLLAMVQAIIRDKAGIDALAAAHQPLCRQGVHHRAAP